MEKIDFSSKAVYAWGLGKYGALGNGSENNSLIPVRTAIPSKVIPSKLSAGRYFSAFITSQGDLYTFGNNGYSRAGHPKSSGESILVSCGDWHMLVIVGETMRPYAVGFNKYGELGLGHSVPSETLTPVQIARTVQNISAGQHVSFFIDHEGKAWSCGIGTLHGNHSKENQLTPTLVQQVDKLKDRIVVQVSAGFAHCAAVTADGELYTWGNSSNLQLGHGTINPEKEPRLVKSLAGKAITQVSCTRSDKYSHTGCMDNQGNVYTWGSGKKGKLGHSVDKLHPTTSDVLYPKLVQFFTAKKAKEIICAGLHTAVLTQGGELYTFGCGSDGRLGHPECEGHRYLYKEAIPRVIDAFKGKNVVAAASSYYHMLAIIDNKK